jgi:hypothetical protein
VNEAVKETPTVMARLVEFVDVAFMTVKVTVYVPAEAKLCVGFWAALVAPSPKLHCQIEGAPVDMSVNWTDWATAGELGLYVKDAVKAGETETVRLVLFEPEAFDTVNVTVFDPAVVKVWLGFLDVEVPPSPKFQDQEVGDPVDVSVNWMDCPAIGAVGL